MTRNLDTRGNSYSFNLFDRRDYTIYPAGILKYDRPASIVFMRAYPVDSNDWLHYLEYSDGSAATVFLDPADGMSKASAENLVSYSYEAGCAEILMDMAPVFIADAWDEKALDDMRSAGIFSVWFEDQTIQTNDADANLEPNQQYGYSLME